MKHVGLVIDKNVGGEGSFSLEISKYQSYRVYSDELPLAKWLVVRGGLRTFYFKLLKNPG